MIKEPVVINLYLILNDIFKPANVLPGAYIKQDVTFRLDV